jgi:hypothetical protein
VREPVTSESGETITSAGAFEVSFPQPGEYTFAGRTFPVVVIAVAPHGELRVVDRDGAFRTLPEHRVRLLPSVP